MFFTKEELTKIYKEIFPYGFYNSERYLNNIGNIDEACKFIKESKQDFITSLKNSGSQISETEFDM